MQRKNENKFQSFVEKNKVVSILVALFLFIGIATPITYAFLQDSTAEVTNIFTPGKVSTKVVEDFEDNIKTNVRIENKGNVPAYIRAAIIINWVDENGNYAAESPVKGKDYNIDINDIETKWYIGKDGYYYHKKPVNPKKVAADPDSMTSVLIKSANPIGVKEGYTLSIEILGSGIQATPKEAVEKAWPVTVKEDGTIEERSGN